MSDGGAVNLLQKRLDKSHMDDDESNIKLVRLLEHLPLAIKQASAYMAMNSLSTAKYYNLCQSSDKNLIKFLSNGFEEFEGNKGTSKPVATTWPVSFESILKDELAAQYLKFKCCVAGQHIPLSLLPNRQDEIKTYEAIGTLKDFAFITERQESESYDAHRLVRLAMQNWLEQQGGLGECLETTIQQLSSTFPIPKYDNRKLWVKLLPHAQTASALQIALQPQYEIPTWLVTIELLSRVANSLRLLGQYKPFEQTLQQVSELQKRLLPKGNPDITITMGRQGGALYYEGEYKVAEQMLQQTLELQKKLLSGEHPETISIMRRLGRALYTCDGLTAGQSEAATPDYLPHLMAVALSADSGRRVGRRHPSRRCRW